MKSARSFVLRSTLPLMLSALAVALVPGCGDDESSAQTSSSSSSDSSSSSSSGNGSGGSGGGSASSGGGGAGGQTGSFHLSGTLLYEYVPYDLALDLLDYALTKKRPIRGASVRLLDADTSVEVAKTLSNDEGAYSFDYMGPAKVKIWVYAETEIPVITVEDNTSGDEVYVVESATADSAEDAKLDVLATTGWDGASYTKPRASAPFAVLDTAYLASQRFLNEAIPAPQFPPLKVNWSINNRPEDGDPAKGQIHTSHWDKKELYILGKEDVDTDEFDSHIIVHEWGHYFQSKIVRSDTIGGTHADGDIVDPRVAWSEGSCNALSAIILDPDPVYTDSSGPQQGMGSIIDMETNDKSPEINPGWFSEASVQTLVFDLYDGPNEPFDKTSVGLNAIYGAMLGQKKRAALTTLFSFVASLKEDLPQAAADIDALTAYYNVDADFGVSAIQDEWATGETHTGGIAPSLPVYKAASVGSSYTVDMTGDENSNRLSQNNYFRIVGDGLPVTVETTGALDVDLAVYDVGVIIAESKNVDGNESVTFATVSGVNYVVTVNGFEKAAMSYSVDLSVTH